MDLEDYEHLGGIVVSSAQDDAPEPVNKELLRWVASNSL